MKNYQEINVEIWLGFENGYVVERELRRKGSRGAVR
jgi:hypothetical protein